MVVSIGDVDEGVVECEELEEDVDFSVTFRSVRHALG